MACVTLDRILSEVVVNFDGSDAGVLKDKLVGASFIVVTKDDVLYRGAAGYVSLPPTADHVEKPPRFSTDSFTWVASMTKIITVTCLLQLVERGAISLDHDDLRTIVPELEQMQIIKGFDDTTTPERPILVDNNKPITLRHLLTHTVGLGYDIADNDLLRWSHTIKRTITNLSFTWDGWNTPLKFSPGHGWYYGSAMDWAGKVLETVTGQTLGAYMAEHIFAPLDIHDSTFRSQTVADRTAGRTVSCSIRDLTTGIMSVCPLPVPVDPPVESGGAGLWTTAEDYAKMLQSVLRSSAGDPGGLVSKKTVEEMFKPQLDEVQHAMLKSVTDMFHDGMLTEFPPGTPINHGIGGVINTEDVPGKRRKGSMMWFGMANSHWWVDRETGIAAALIVNVLSDADPVVRRLYDELELAVYAELVPEWAAKGGAGNAAA